MCSLDEAERSIHIRAHRLLILEYLSLRLCRRAAYIRRQTHGQTVKKSTRMNQVLSSPSPAECVPLQRDAAVDILQYFQYQLIN